MTRHKKQIRRFGLIITAMLALCIAAPALMNSKSAEALAIVVGQKTTFKSDYANKSEMRKAARDYNEYAAAQSFVLLKNEDSALPLAKNSGVTVFGVYSTRLFQGGGGSGSQSEPAALGTSQGKPDIPGGAITNLNVALNNAGGLRVNPAMTPYYSGRQGIAPARSQGNGFVGPLSGLSFSRIEEDIYAGTTAASSGFASAVPGTATGVDGPVKDTWADDYNDAAIVVIARTGSEGDEYALYNVPGHANPYETYYSPDDNELQLIDYCAANFSKVIVLINAGNAMELTKLEDNPNVDAVMFVGMMGGTGANAVGRVLTGEIAPSGRASDLYNANIRKDPLWVNYGANIQSHLTLCTVAEFNDLRETWNLANGATEARKDDGKISLTSGNTPAMTNDTLVTYTYADPWDRNSRVMLPSDPSTWTQAQRQYTGPIVPIMATSGNVGWRGAPSISQYYMVRDKNGIPITPNTGSHMNAESRLGMIDYEEGIYLGYRFYETADHEGFLEAQFAAEKPTEDINDYLPDGVTDTYYNRYNGVLYPFGHGLSYTTFDYEILNKASLSAASLNINEGAKMKVFVKVTNTGYVTSREVLQLYVTAPYTPGEIEKSHVQMIAFAKTGELKPWQSEVVELEFLIQHIASFDWSDANNNGYKGYELDAGQYTFSLRKNSHDVIDSFNVMSAAKQYLYDDVTGTEVKPLFSPKVDASGDLINTWDGTRNDDNYYSMYRSEFVSADGTSKASIMSRANFAATWPKAPETGDLEYSDNALRIILAQSAYSSFNDLPTDPWFKDEALFKKAGEALSYGGTATEDGPYSNWTQANGTLTLTNTGGGQGRNHVTRNNPSSEFPARTPIQLWDMSGVAFDDPKWEAFLNQLTFQEMGIMLDTYGKDGQNGFFQIDSIGRPVIRAEDGPSSLKINFGSTVGTAFIIPINIACTFDIDVAYQIGRFIAHDGLYSGTVGWWGPAGQMHRSPLTSRNFEYYAQDPVLSGWIGAYEVMGAVDMGMIVHLKHLFFNEQETDRYSLTTFGDEQTVREIYLRPFEFVFKYGKCNSSMSSYPRSGLLHPTSNYRLYETVLFDEWGFKGYSVTDYYNQQNVSTSPTMSIRANNLPLNRWSSTFGHNLDGVWDPALNGGRGGVVSEYGVNYSPSGYGSLSDTALRLETINNHHTTFGGPGTTSTNNGAPRAIGTIFNNSWGDTVVGPGPSAAWKDNDTGKVYGNMVYNAPHMIQNPNPDWEEDGEDEFIPHATATKTLYKNSAGDEMTLYANGDKINAWTQWYQIRKMTHRTLYIQVNSAAMMNGLVRNPWADNMVVNGSGATSGTSAMTAGATFKTYSYDIKTNMDATSLQLLTNSGVNLTYRLMETPGYNALPEGLTLNPVTGIISGTPILPGNYTFDISVNAGDEWAGEGSGYTTGNNGSGGYRYPPMRFTLMIADTLANIPDENTIKGWITAATENFLTGAQVQALIDAASHVTISQVQAMIDAAPYLTAAQVDTLIAANGFQTAAQVNDIIAAKGYLTTAQVQALIDIAVDGLQDADDVDALITAALSGYLTSTQIDKLIADQGFQTAAQINDIIAAKGYLTSTQVQNLINIAVDGLQDADDVDALITAALSGYLTSAQIDTLIAGKGFQTAAQVNEIVNAKVNGLLSEAKAQELIDKAMEGNLTKEQVQKMIDDAIADNKGCGSSSAAIVALFSLLACAFVVVIKKQF